jgi:hypothetical protein
MAAAAAAAAAAMWGGAGLHWGAPGAPMVAMGLAPHSHQRKSMMGGGGGVSGSGVWGSSGWQR